MRGTNGENETHETKRYRTYASSSLLVFRPTILIEDENGKERERERVENVSMNKQRVWPPPISGCYAVLIDTDRSFPDKSHRNVGSK